MPHESTGPTRASQALKRWMKDTDTSQVRLAELVTEKLGRSKPVNQSTISSWARGAYPPGGPGMVALQEIAGITLTDWLVPADSNEAAPSSPSSSDAHGSGTHPALSASGADDVDAATKLTGTGEG